MYAKGDLPVTILRSIKFCVSLTVCFVCYFRQTSILQKVKQKVMAVVEYFRYRKTVGE